MLACRTNPFQSMQPDHFWVEQNSKSESDFIQFADLHRPDLICADLNMSERICVDLIQSEPYFSGTFELICEYTSWSVQI